MTNNKHHKAMKLTVANLIGRNICVQSATSDSGMTNDPSGWWMPYDLETKQNIPPATFRALMKRNFIVTKGGWENGKLISVITTIVFH